jgi:DNA polymerase/3'-5' exonuclease PolX
VHLVGEGVGVRQVEILHQSIVKHGGVLLQELPRHSHYTHAADKARQKRREREAAAAAAQAHKSASAKAAAAAAAAAVAAAEPPKLDILILCSPSIRTKKELVDVLVRRARHQQAKLDVKLLHVPQRSSASTTTAGAVSPPGSPRSHASTSPVASPARPTAAAGLSGSGADASGKDKIRLRSNWRIAHLTYLVDCNRRQALLPFDRYALDDEDPAQLAAANKKLELLNASTASTSGAALSLPQAAAPAASGVKLSSAAAEPDTSSLAAAAVDDDEADDGGDDDGDGAYADPSKPRSAAEIVAWNTAIASQLEEVSQKYRAQSKEQWFRESAFRQAASVVRSLPFALTDARQVAGMKGIGSSILEEIRSILATGHSGRLEALKSDPKLQVLQLLQSVHGIGPAIAEKLYAQGVRTLDDLRARGSLTAQQALSLRYYDELTEKIPRAEVAEFEQRIRAVLKTIDPRLRMEVCGSYRRGKATCGDIDVLVSHPDPHYRYSDEHSRRDAAAASSASSSAHRGGGGGGHKSSFQYLLEELMRRLHAQGLLTDDLVHPSSKQRYKAHTVQNIYESGLENETYSGIGMIPRDEQRQLGGKHRRIDIKVYSTAEFPFALLYFTGSKDFNRLMRLYCNRHRSLSLSDKALTPYVSGGRAAKAGGPRTKLATGMAIPCASEEDIFRAVGLEYIPPTQRDTIPPIFLGK